MLEGKKIVVTGASRGIGRAIALACARAGAVVGLNYRASEESARALEKAHLNRFILLPFDVRDGEAVYAATKGGVEAQTRALAVEYGRKGIRVHAIRPGPIETEMLESTQAWAADEILARVPLHRLGRPEEVADLAVYLLSDKAGF